MTQPGQELSPANDPIIATLHGQDDRDLTLEHFLRGLDHYVSVCGVCHGLVLKTLMEKHAEYHRMQNPVAYRPADFAHVYSAGLSQIIREW